MSHPRFTAAGLLALVAAPLAVAAFLNQFAPLLGEPAEAPADPAPVEVDPVAPPRPATTPTS